MLTAARPTSLSRFKNEFRALAELSHPNLVRMHELFEHEGQWSIVMELVTGCDLLTWVRHPAPVANSNGVAFHERRLREALRDLSQGLSALHVAGLVHRDLKPSNIRVTPEGRAVLLDFGLVTGLDSDAQSTHAGAPGTAAYMAPEQAASLKVSAAADWYALGVCLYEVLTGRLPFFAETALGLMLAKQGKLPPLPSSVLMHTATIPTDLESLCMQLLEPDPARRAGAEAISEVLSREESPIVRVDSAESSLEATALMSLPALGVPLQGRESELHLLSEAFARTQHGELRMVLVEGESGIGKTTLVHAFVRLLKGRHSDALVLSGRCYENEQVPYKAFDGCIDELTRVLKRIPKERCEGMMPPRAGLIAQLFPVLDDVPAIARASLKGASAEPNARRLEAFQALRELLHKLAVERPLVLVVDDLQWADAESFRLLRAVLEGKPPLLLVFMVRPREELQERIQDNVLELYTHPGTEVITLKGLPAAGAQALATQLLGESAPAGWLEAIMRESQGHPLFIDALAQYAASHDVDSGSISLEAALAARIEGVNESAQRLLDLLALAGKPHDRRVLERAFGGSLDAALAPLLTRKLARTLGEQQLVCFHDRVRTLVVRKMERRARAGHHRALAESLAEAAGTDPAEAALHWQEAGELEQASIGFEKAADAALAALAFARSAELYQQALSLCPEGDEEGVQRLTVQRAHALARGGRSAEAAELYQEVAQRTEGELQVRLRIWAAQHLLQSAQVAQGMAAARGVLSDIGMGLPVGEKAALARIFWDRARMGIRGLGIKPVREGGVDPRTALQLEAAWQLAAPLAAVDILSSANLSAAHLRRALDAGDPAHAARALAHEATMRAVQKPFSEDNYRPLIDASRELSERVGDPALQAFVTWVDGLAAIFRDDYRRALDPFRRAELLLRERCPNEPWLLTSVRSTLGAALHNVGEHQRLAAQTEAWLAEARERRDVFAEANVYGLGGGFLRHLMDDDPRRALSELERTIGALPREPFSNSAMGELWAISFTETYQGGTGLQRWLDRERPRLGRALLLKSSGGKAALAALHAHAAIGVSVDCSGKQRKQRPRPPRSWLATLKRPPAGSAAALGLVLDAQLFALEGKADRALELARSGAQRLAELGLFQQHAASYLQGLLEGGEGGRERRDAALAFFRGQGWKRPERAIRMCIPALPALETPERRPATTRRSTLADRFELLQTLGQGGYGNVTLARDLQTGRHVAIKELTRTSPGALLRFKREFRALQALKHPRLVRLDALFESQGSWFIAMQWVEGTDLRKWTRPEGKLDVQRVREAFASLAEGLSALHEAGFCHRDIKPENVRVTPEGKVVLLDFGLIGDLSDETSDDAEVGTAAYMAPEQKPGSLVGPEADLYALGVCLYESLCGRLPFEGDLPVHIMQNKRRGLVPPAPSQKAPQEDIPKELEALALALLTPAPEARPSLADLSERLRGGSVSLATSSLMSAPAPSLRPVRAPQLTGREAELAALDAALANSRQGLPRVVLVEGESGIGKSALVEHWLTRVRQREPSAYLLRGRCYENEQVPYSALDGVVDELARVLRKLPQEACQALLPPCAAVLAELFRSLGSVRAIGEAPRKGVLADPLARRQQGFTALRTLLRNLGSEGPVVLAVDDLQWADLESFRLLKALLREEGAPPVLLVATIRSENERNTELGEAVAELLSWPFSTKVSLGPLGDGPARTMVARMLDTQDDELVQRVVKHAHGHPLFLAELAAHARNVDNAQGLTLDEAVSARLAALAPGARRLIELVAIAGRPYGLHVYERALESDGLVGQKLDEAVAVLSAAKLVRVRKDQQVVCFHDRIRTVAATRVARSAQKSLHLRLARAVDEEPGAEPAERARLWDYAAEPARAAGAYEEAGSAALQALAFQQAARLFERALELVPEDRQVRQRLMIQRAHALARGGRSADAARLYQQAAETAEGELKVRLGIWAAQHLLQGAQVEPGLKAARALLSELGMGLPEGQKAAIARIVWDRARIGMRGLVIRPAPEAGVDPRTKLQLEAAWQLAAPLAAVDLLPSANLSAGHLHRALDSGDPAHAARALAQEATMRAIQKPFAVTYLSLLETSRKLADQVGDPSLDAFVTWVEGMTALFRQEFPRALESFRRAELVLREQCADDPWLLTNVRTMLGAMLGKVGEQRRLAVQMQAWLAEARERGDLFAQTTLFGLGCGFFRHLMEDDLEMARTELERTMAAWPREPFSNSGLGEIYAISSIELYLGGEGLQHWLERERSRLRSALMLKTAHVALEVAEISARGALGGALASSSRGGHKELLRKIRPSVAHLKHAKSVEARAHALVVEAQLLALEGNLEAALQRATKAQQAFAALGAVYQHSASYLRGLLEGGDAGRARRDAALGFFATQGWKRPDRAIVMMLPALPAIEKG